MNFCWVATARKLNLSVCLGEVPRQKVIHDLICWCTKVISCTLKILKLFSNNFNVWNVRDVFTTSVILRDMKKSVTVILLRTCGKVVFTNHKKYLNELEEFGMDTKDHIFIFPHLIVFDTEASLPECADQPTTKRWKICPDENSNPVERKLHFNMEHELLSYSMATNVFLVVK